MNTQITRDEFLAMPETARHTWMTKSTETDRKEMITYWHLKDKEQEQDEMMFILQCNVVRDKSSSRGFIHPHFGLCTIEDRELILDWENQNEHR